MIAIENLGFDYPGVRALDDVSGTDIEFGSAPTRPRQLGVAHDKAAFCVLP